MAIKSYSGRFMRGDVTMYTAVLKSIVRSKIVGKRGRGRSRKTWIQNVREWTGRTTVELSRIAQKIRT